MLAKMLAKKCRLMVNPNGKDAAPTTAAAAAEEELASQPPGTPPKKKKKKKQQQHMDTSFDDGVGELQARREHVMPAEGYRFNTFGMEQEALPRKGAEQEEQAIATIYSRRDFDRRQSLRQSLQRMEEYQQSMPKGHPVLESSPVLAFCQLARIYQLTQGCFLTVFVTQKCPTVIDPTTTSSALVDYNRVWRVNNACGFPCARPALPSPLSRRRQRVVRIEKSTPHRALPSPEK